MIMIRHTNKHWSHMNWSYESNWIFFISIFWLTKFTMDNNVYFCVILSIGMRYVLMMMMMINRLIDWNNVKINDLLLFILCSSMSSSSIHTANNKRNQIFCFYRKITTTIKTNKQILKGKKKFPLAFFC